MSGLSRMKKAEADMWWIIVGAVLVLIVVIVLLTFFSRGTQKAEAGLSACETTGGSCVSEGTCGEGKEGGTKAPFDCQNKDKPDCCLGMKKV